MPKKLRDTYTTRYIKIGASYGFTMPPDLRDEMNLTPGDVLVMNFSDGVLWAAKVTSQLIIPRATADRIINRLFSDKGKTNGADK